MKPPTDIAFPPALVDAACEAIARCYAEHDGSADHDELACAVLSIALGPEWGFVTLLALGQRLLEDLYPAEVFDGSSGDPGARLAAAVRDCLAVRNRTAAESGDGP